jgi:DNA-binding response OmpR family regulator
VAAGVGKIAPLPQRERARLRRELEADPSHPRHVVTEAGMGYRFEP